MKFEIIYNNNQEARELFYIADEYAFNSEPHILEIDLEIIINQIALSVVNSKVIQVNGFCPYTSWINMDCNAPQYSTGELRVLDHLNPGFSYSVNKTDWPVYVNIRSGWVCVGDFKGAGRAVEFIKNCVAVVNQEKFIALWLKPESLPLH